MNSVRFITLNVTILPQISNCKNTVIDLRFNAKSHVISRVVIILFQFLRYFMLQQRFHLGDGHLVKLYQSFRLI